MKKYEINIFNDDFKEFIGALNSFNVDYILIGGYSVILHGYSRTTGDLDIWVRKTADNYYKISEAFNNFGIPSDAIGLNRFLNHNEYDVFSFGRSPVSIDIVTEIQGVEFENAFNNIEKIEVQGIKINLLNFNDLISTKKATGRFKDLDDLDNLNRTNREE